ncbi:hypothetical protein RFI_30862 [Reticulomyxa filosa]|uniref:Uncharacterized protein n=1 Tax=Reticulomyxa filosa TaxID=46433 RepID=X6M0M7_RETFI|nr:hypothetical protein RFI_30862 [Reticulomyxa filosa]|eukprot:ETO06530.1 hypothetical protein RFI_30862 [Reticulomyxa filosa]
MIRTKKKKRRGKRKRTLAEMAESNSLRQDNVPTHGNSLSTSPSNKRQKTLHCNDVAQSRTLVIPDGIEMKQSELYTIHIKGQNGQQYHLQCHVTDEESEKRLQKEKGLNSSPKCRPRQLVREKPQTVVLPTKRELYQLGGRLPKKYKLMIAFFKRVITRYHRTNWFTFWQGISKAGETDLLVNVPLLQFKEHVHHDLRNVFRKNQFFFFFQIVFELFLFHTFYLIPFKKKITYTLYELSKKKKKRAQSKPLLLWTMEMWMQICRRLHRKKGHPNGKIQ